MYNSLLHHVLNIMELYLYVFGLVMKYMVLCHVDATLIITVDVIYVRLCIKKYGPQLANPNSFTTG